MATHGCRGRSIPRDLNENQYEQNDYAILSYQKTFGDLNYQISGFGRYSAPTSSPTASATFSSTAWPAT